MKIPDNLGGNEYEVTIDGPASIINLNISTTVNLLNVQNGAVVQVTGGLQSLTIAPGGTLSNEGTIRAVAGSTLQLTADVRQPGGVGTLGADGTGSRLEVVNGSTVIDGSLMATNMGVVMLNNSTATNALLTSTGGGNIQVVNNSTVIAASLEVIGGIVEAGDNTTIDLTGDVTVDHERRRANPDPGGGRPRPGSGCLWL